MATFVYLINWTDRGIHEVQDTATRAEQAGRVARNLGGSMELLWTMGRYDLICTAQFPDDETAAAFSMEIARQGAIRTETLRAFTADEMKASLAKLS